MRRFLLDGVFLALPIVIVSATSFAQSPVSAKQVVTFGIHRTFAKAAVFQKASLPSVVAPALQVETPAVTSTKITAGFGTQPASTISARNLSTSSKLRKATYQPELQQDYAFSEVGKRMRNPQSSSFIFTITE